MKQSNKNLSLIFGFFIIFGILVALGVIEESFQKAFYMSLPILTAGWYGAHAKEHDLESPTSIQLILLTLFILPIGMAYYFYTNFEKKQATIMFLKSILIGFILISIIPIIDVIFNGIAT